VAAGEPLARQPGLVVLDAGGNRVLDPPVTVSASLAHDNVTAVRDAPPPPPRPPVEPFLCIPALGVRAVCGFRPEAFLIAQAGLLGGALDLSGTRDLLSLKGAVRYTDLRPLRAGPGLTLRFDIPGFASVLSATPLGITPRSPVALRILQQPADAIGGLAFPRQPRVELLDVYGNRVTAEPRNVSVALAETPQAFPGRLLANGGELTTAGAIRFVGEPGRLELMTEAGVAAFRQLTIDKVASCYSLTFTSPGLAPATSASFDVLFGPAFKIVLAVEPAGVEPGLPVRVAPEVRVTDVGGNLISKNDDRISVRCVAVTVGGGNESVPLRGTRELRALRGVARFPGLVVDRATPALVFVFARSAGGMLDVASRPMDVRVGAPHSLFVLTEPGGPAPGRLLAVQPAVEVCDAGGNRVVEGGFLVTASLMQAGRPRADLLPRGPLCGAFECLNQCGPNGTCADPRVHCPTCVKFLAPAMQLGFDPVLSVNSSDGVAAFSELAIERAVHPSPPSAPYRSPCAWRCQC
jgi:hypothetical protein